ncbi:hypothetical protein F2P81_016565 [Scophthalmus maximus]|uniref:Uncharacterized protein n=1 Tax=Scophthalmus maximus TaxID=52904 RepID=A0A6A4SJG1_SCOMX|nr:hypothetical protein F2P81_016565 [Scophthalmus maximus]
MDRRAVGTRIEGSESRKRFVCRACRSVCRFNDDGEKTTCPLSLGSRTSDEIRCSGNPNLRNPSEELLLGFRTESDEMTRVCFGRCVHEHPEFKQCREWKMQKAGVIVLCYRSGLFAVERLKGRRAAHTGSAE